MRLHLPQAFDKRSCASSTSWTTRIPLHSGYTFRTLAILREQRKLGWETFHLTSPKHTAHPGGWRKTVDGWHFYRTPPRRSAAPSCPAWARWR